MNLIAGIRRITSRIGSRVSYTVSISDLIDVLEETKASVGDVPVTVSVLLSSKLGKE